MICPLCDFEFRTDLEIARHLVKCHHKKLIRSRDIPCGTIKIIPETPGLIRIACFCWANKTLENNLRTKCEPHLVVPWLASHFEKHGGFEKHYTKTFLERYLDLPIVRD